jgi:alkanesulfonate monooxygenase SsuD/methylene tetrahydromethanopterin reductase-like flavin-dependent oxidoreductase (luciferase family)
MKFGMLHLFENPIEKTEYQTVKEQLALMKPAEHHFSEYGYCGSPALSLAAIAAETKRIRLGTGIVVLPFHNPIRVAEEFAMLDLMSDGRVDFGVGRGYQPTEYKGFQVDQVKSRGIFNEALEVVLQAWTQEKVNFKGVHFNIQDQPVRPKPLQKPHPPVYVASISDATFPMVGKWGFNLLCAPVFGFQGKSAEDLLEKYRGALRQGGHDPAKKEVAALCMVYCADSVEQARKEFEQPVLWYYRTISKYVAPPAGQEPVKSYEVYAKTRDLAATISWDQLLEAGAVICGDADHCVQEISKISQKYGFTQLLCWSRLGGLDHRKVMHSMELMQHKVFPHFRKPEQRAA